MQAGSLSAASIRRNAHVRGLPLPICRSETSMAGRASSGLGSPVSSSAIIASSKQRDAARMDAQDIDGISAWLVERGLAGDSEIALLHGFCERCHEAGLALSRGVAIIDTLHPVYEGRAFFWARDKSVETPVSEYGPSTTGNSADTMAPKPVLPSAARQRRRVAPPARDGRADRVRGYRRAAARRADRLHRHGAAVRQGSGHRRDGLFPLALADDAARRLQRCRSRRASPAGPVARPGDQVDVAGARRNIAGRNLSRPRRRPPRACRPHVARLGGEDPCRPVVLGHSRLHCAFRGHGVRSTDPAA